MAAFPLETDAAPSRKRRRSASPVQGADETPDAPLKKPKIRHPDFPPPRFWDNLPEVPLTRNALRELDRRNSLIARRRVRRAAVRAKARISAKGGVPSPQDPILDLTDLRGYPRPLPDHKMNADRSVRGRRKRGSQSASNSNSTATPAQGSTPGQGSAAEQNVATKTKSTGPYDAAFQMHLIQHDIYPRGYQFPDGRDPPEPDNLDDIVGTLRQRRRSLSPTRFSKDDFGKFQRAEARAFNESVVTRSVIPIVEGDISDGDVMNANVSFENLNHLTDGSLVSAKPDLYYGSQPATLHRKVRRILHNYVVPTTREEFPIAPNFFLEIKGPAGTLSVASRQASYCGVLGERGILQLHSYGGVAPVYDNKAHTITAVYMSGMLKLYAIHAVRRNPPATQPEYFLNLVGSYSLDGDAESFRWGTAAFRNARDWARQQREDAIRKANAAARRRPSPESASSSAANAMEGTSQETAMDTVANGPLSWDPDTSADELSMDFVRPVKWSKVNSKLRASRGPAAVSESWCIWGDIVTTSV